MDTVFVKKGSSKSYTNLITSSAPIPLKKLSQEPIGQQQQQQPQPLGINNIETETTHRREKLQLECGSGFVSFSKSTLLQHTELDRNTISFLIMFIFT